MTATNSECKTVYIKNLPDKPPKEEIRRALYVYCAQFGPVLEVHVPCSRNMYGQAFVVFPDLAIANTCRRVMHNIVFYNRVVHVSLAERPSFIADPLERRRRDARREKAQLEHPQQHGAAEGLRKRLRDE